MDVVAAPDSDTPGSGAPGARVDRAFAFIDLSGFTALTDAEGDAEAVRVLGEFRREVRRISSDRAVRVAKWLGDGAMLVSVVTESLVEAVVELQHSVRNSGSGLPLHAGIACGPVIVFDGDDYIGSVVNLASRLCDIAEPGSVIAPASIASRKLGNISAEPIGVVELQGFEETLEVVRLDWATNPDDSE